MSRDRRSPRATRFRRPRLVALLIPAAVTVALAAVPAEAVGKFTSPYFTPTLKVESDNTGAGAHPNLTLRMRKAHPNNCSPDYPWVGGVCFDPDPYIEQDLRDWDMTFPPGLMADVSATQERCKDPQPDPLNNYEYSCPPESKIGDVYANWRICKPADEGGMCDGTGEQGRWPIGGEVYMGVPKAGEKARLHELIGLLDEGTGTILHYIRIDTTVAVRQGRGGLSIEVATPDIPDVLCLTPSIGCPPATAWPTQVYDMAITLHGATGSERGHPLLTNPTSCQGRLFGSVFTGYAGYSQYGYPGEGYGNTVSTSAPFPVTGCNRLDYSPTLSLSLSDHSPEAVPALTTSISQDKGEQTTGEVVVEFPSAFDINPKNRITPCPQDKLSTDSCPASSRIGSAVARSRLVPGGELTGSVYMGEAGKDNFPLLISLKGFVDLALRGSVAAQSDGTYKATFEGLPEVPLESFRMSLEGGEAKGLLKNPKSCETALVRTTFKSHQSKEITQATPVEIGCSRGTFDVSVSPRRSGAHPTVSLEAYASGIRDLSFTLPRALRIQSTRRLSWSRGYGTLTLSTLSGQRSYPLKLTDSSRRTVNLTATESGTAMSRASLRLPRTRRSCRRVKRKGSARGRRARGKRTVRRCRRTARGSSRLSLTDLPRGLTGVSVELEGRRDRFLKNPARCRRSGKGRARLGSAARPSARKRKRGRTLHFSARIVDVKGTTYSPAKAVKLRCAKKKRRSRRGGSKRRSRR